MRTVLGKAGIAGSVLAGVFSVGSIVFGGADAEAAAVSAMPFLGEYLGEAFGNTKARATELVAMKRTEDDAFAVLEADRKRAAEDEEAVKTAEEEERKDLQGALLLEISRESSRVQDTYPSIETDTEIADIPSDFLEAVIDAYKR